ncbi:hypothetical protein GCM10010399_44320 [Dactylosporangium fulvum]|uniref:Uncharacterized protein n=1 Tax=Dactylosporangium fulvum TaxID=53359 RepID=A0ABY5W799_9ACTN|nr:hypothetical protein [Dactylosporangium fulvum]UWP85900.1 hypothetical protein Dfulv_17275 [Dactylosporangium fulvum]
MADDPNTGTALDPALMDALRQVRELTEDLPATLRQAIRSAVTRVEDRSHEIGLAERQRRNTADNLGPLLNEWHREAEKLLEMHLRDGRLWEHAADQVPLLAARVYAAVKAQEPR